MKNGGKNKSVAFVILFSVYIYTILLPYFNCKPIILMCTSFVPNPPITTQYLIYHLNIYLQIHARGQTTQNKESA